MVMNKEEKEEFVSGLQGSPLVEVVGMTVVPSLLLLLYGMLMKREEKTQKIWKHIVLEYVVLLLPEVLLLTGAVPVALLLAGTCCCCCGIAGIVGFYEREYAGKGKLKVEDSEDRMLRDSVSVHRVHVMMVTCLSILAVDFHAFPRKYAKTEHFGTGFMDAGVGSIVLCSSFVLGLRAKSSDVDGSVRRDARSRQRRSNMAGIWSRYGNRTRRVGLLLLLGLGRPTIISYMGYQQHVGEYGLHWNFFLTLAVLQVCRPLLPVSGKAALSLGTVILITHQTLLSQFGLNELVHSESRGSNIVIQNKEGLISMGGYLSLHVLGGWAAGVYSALGRKSVPCIRQACFVAILWISFQAALMFEPVSRRSCNASFVLWMLANNVQAIFLNSQVLQFLRSYAGRYSVPRTFQSLNNGMLYVFLLANVLTGMVNSTVDTLSVSDRHARAILLVYMALVQAISIGSFSVHL